MAVLLPWPVSAPTMYIDKFIATLISPKHKFVDSDKEFTILKRTEITMPRIMQALFANIVPMWFCASHSVTVRIGNY